MYGEVGRHCQSIDVPIDRGYAGQCDANVSDGAPIVSFRLNTAGAKKFSDVTRDNVDKPFAVVLDKEIITAPRINEAICMAAVISGNFTVREAPDLALLLRAGALPTSLSIVKSEPPSLEVTGWSW